MIILPRQAGDKHRKQLITKAFFAGPYLLALQQQGATEVEGLALTPQKTTVSTPRAEQPKDGGLAGIDGTDYRSPR